jgi:HlyD family secretion protein
MKKSNEDRKLMFALGGVLMAFAVLAIIGFLFVNKPPEILQGEADASSIRIAGKLPGRVVELFVREGDLVNEGDTLVHIHSSLADAKLMQARALEDAAVAVNRKVDAGTRPQIIRSAYDLLQQAEAAVGISRKTYERLETLFKQGVVSEQKRDEAKAAYDAALAGADAARNQYELALQGAQSEDKTQALAMVTVAEGGVAEVESLLEDQYLVAPCSGQVDVIYPQVGELVSIGSPIMNLLRLDDKWVTFNVREEHLKDFAIGGEKTVMIPALNIEAPVEVFYIRDLGTYATWHATKTTGDWDSKTFEVKARPLSDIPDLRPGMTVLLR